MISIQVIGRLGRDAELRHTNTNVPVITFSLASESGYGQNKQTEWFDCSLFGKQAETLDAYLKKGKQVAVSGSFSTYKSEKGNVYIKVRTNDIKLLGGNTEAQGSNAKDNNKTSGEFNDDDIPF